MRSLTITVLSCASAVSAYPFLNHLEGALAKKQTTESNCGPVPCAVFDAQEQYVDVTDSGPHPFIAPGSGDLRGECPGLNAAANHGFLPRNGITTISQTAAGLNQAYGMSPDLANFLSVVAIALTGDYVTQSWSIGGPFSTDTVGGLLSTPGGIVNSHNKYEGDASVARGDAYLHNGNSFSLVMAKFDKLYQMTDSFTPDILRQHNGVVHDYSVANNPYYFSGPFSGFVTPAAHQFIINFMSNHSAEEPSGYLNREILKSFYAIDGPDDAHVWHPGQERIPLNWYRRTNTNQYSLANVAEDIAITAATNPNLALVGGNTGTTNSFTGVDLGNLTGGVYNAQNIMQGNNLGCFFFQSFEAGLPDQLAGLVSDAAPVLSMVKQYTDPIIGSLDCPQLETYNQGLFNQFPGYKYTPRPASGPSRK